MWRRHVSFAVCVASLLWGCNHSASPPSPDNAQAPARPSAAAAPASAAPGQPSPPPVGSSGLPENPELGKRSEQQWREHLDDEDRERQLIFDRKRLQEHRAVVALIKAARARYDRASTEAALTKARGETPAKVEDIRKRVAELDHWGNNSHLLGDYAALETALTADYADAKEAALKGDGAPLKKARASFDEHLKTIAEWLERAERGEGEEHE